MGENNEMEVDAINEAGAKVGDRIVLNLETGPLLKVTFLLYVFPIILLIIGAAIGQRIATMLGMDSSGLSVLVGFTFLFAAVLFIKLKANNLAKNDKYRPTIIKIIK
jgi:sigma-E factor negative regulatory protein RseC